MPERRHSRDRGGMQWWRGSTRILMQCTRPFRSSRPFCGPAGSCPFCGPADSRPYCGTAELPMVLAAPTDQRGGMRRGGSYGTATHLVYGARSTMARTERRGIRRRAGYGSSTHPSCGTDVRDFQFVGSSSTRVGG